MIKDFVLETSNAPGTATTINLAGPVADRVAFSTVFINGAPVFYFMDDGAQAEWGAGVFNSGTPNTITRTTVLGNTANTTTRLNFLGTTRVYCEVPSARVAYIDNANELRVPSLRLSTALSLFTSDANYSYLFWDSAGWRLQYTRANGTLAYNRGGDNAPLFTIDGLGNVAWPGSATTGPLTVNGALTATGIATAPQFKLAAGNGGGWFGADGTFSYLTFDGANWSWRYQRSSGTLQYIRGADGVPLFTIDGSGNVGWTGAATSTGAVVAPQFKLNANIGSGWFGADANYTYLNFDTSNWRWLYTRANGTLAYARGWDGYWLLSIDPSGNVYWPGTGTSGGTIQSNGGRIISFGGDKPSVNAYHNAGYSGGMWAEANGDLSFGWTDGSGRAYDQRAYFRRSDGIFIVASVMYSGGQTSADSFMCRSGVFRVANAADGYYLNRGTDGAWRFVEGGFVNFTIDVSGNAFSRANLYAGAGLVFAGGVGSDCYFGVGGSGRIMQMAGSWYWDYNGGNSNLTWNTPYGAFLHIEIVTRLISNRLGPMGGAGDYQNISDERAKTAITPAQAGLPEILRLNPIRFRRIHNFTAGPEIEEREEVGFSAQDVQQVIPEAVAQFGGDEEMLSLGTTPILAATVNAIKELATTNAALVTTMREMEMRLAALETKGVAT